VKGESLKAKVVLPKKQKDKLSKKKVEAYKDPIETDTLEMLNHRC
jgi:hypothetical protein